MSELTELLRDDARSEWGICNAAANEIERLTATIAGQREKLELADAVRAAQVDGLAQGAGILRDERDALRAEVTGLREDAERWAKDANDRDDIASAWAAACAFIDSHCADPDITQDMRTTYREFLKWREHLAARKGAP